MPQSATSEHVIVLSSEHLLEKAWDDDADPSRA
jgi:hypothetical protein